MAVDQGLRGRPACLDSHISLDYVGSDRVQDDLKLVHSHGRPLRGVAVQQQSQARLADAGEGGELALRDVLSVHHAPNERYEIAQDRSSSGSSTNYDPAVARDDISPRTSPL